MIDDFKNTTVSIVTIPTLIDEQVQVRRMYKRLTSASTSGINTDEIYDGPYLPDRDESLEWVQKSSCKIGSICIPGGDCYGGGLDHCKGFGLTTKWVVKRMFQFKGSSWIPNSLLYRQGCVQDWECYTIHNRGSYVISIINTPKPDFLMKEVKCLLVRNNTFCSVAVGTTRSLWFQDEHGCVNIANWYACIKKLGDQEEMYSNEYKGSSIDDFKMLTMEIAERIGYQQYNNLVIMEQISDLRNVINKIIVSISRFNPFILGDILSRSVYSTKQGNHLLVCPCQSPNENLDDGNDNSGDSEKGVHEASIFIGGETENILLSDPDYRGMTENVHEDVVEKDYDNSMHFQSIDSEGGHPYTFMNFNHPFFSLTNAYLPYINLALNLMMLLRDR